MSRKAVIETVTKGKLKGQFRFVLVAPNGEIVGSSYPETYTQKHSCVETLESNFPDWEKIDNTGKEKLHVFKGKEPSYELVDDTD